MTRYARRRDNTQVEIARALTAAGWETFDYSRAGFGVPDMIAKRAGFSLWVECKTENESDLTPAETKFARICPGDVIVAVTGAQAVERAEMVYRHYQNSIKDFYGVKP